LYVHAVLPGAVGIKLTIAQVLMQSTALQDLAHPLLEFQALTKVLLRRWREVKVDLEVKEHRVALKGLHLASAPESKGEGGSMKKRHNPEKWRRLGFETESPAWEFGGVGFLGMMDLTDFVRKDEDSFRKVRVPIDSSPSQT
jgi:engulfment/cell motility protein 1